MIVNKPKRGTYICAAGAAFVPFPRQPTTAAPTAGGRALATF
jgi:hypothetical protein